MATKILFQETVDKIMGSVWFHSNTYYAIPGLNLASRNSKWAEAFKPSAVCIVHDKITVSRDVEEGTLIKFSSTGTLPAPLDDITDYYAIRIDATHIKVASSLENAVAGIAIDLTTIGTGIHTLQLPIPEGFGTGTAEDPWRIWTWADLLAWRAEANVLTGYAELCADIDASDSEELNEGAGWLPVGAGYWRGGDEGIFHPTGAGVFTGHFDGNNHIISNLFIYNEDDDDYGVGFFGVINSPASILNLGLTTVDIHGQHGVGALIGWNYGATSIVNCYSTGLIKSQSVAGGLCGYNEMESSISYCYSDCVVSPLNYQAAWSGGFCGVNRSGAQILNCYATGTVGTSVEWGSSHIGGFVGMNQNALIKNCYSTGAISGYHTVGGLCGWNDGSGGPAKIINCFSTSNITAVPSPWVTNANIGGICGWNSSSEIINCYSTGTIIAEKFGCVGGVVGANSYASKIINCFSTSNVTGAGVGGICGANYYVSEITRCYSTGNVIGSGDYLGVDIGSGVGINYGGSTIKNCYSTGSVTGHTNLGGFCGSNSVGVDDASVIINCYSTGLVTCVISDWTASTAKIADNLVMPTVKNGFRYICTVAGTTGGSEPTWPTVIDDTVIDGTVTWKCQNDKVGGFCGYNDPSGTLTSCYYNYETAGQTDGDGNGEPRTTEQMKQQATFVDLDFKYTWRNTEIYEIAFDTGTTKPVIGEILNRVGAAADTCFVLDWTKTSGEWATDDAVGKIWVYRCSNSFITNFANGSDLENAVNALICNSTATKTLYVDSTYPDLFKGFRVLTKDV